MKSISQVYGTLRKKNIGNYGLLMICIFISVLLITVFSVVMNSGTVQTMLPEGGDSRKQMNMIFVLAICGCAVFTMYASSLFFRAKSREVGIFMALGVRKSLLSRLLFGDLLVVSVLSSAAGILLGAPLAAGIWQLFRLLLVDSADMVFSLRAVGFLWPLVFVLFTLGMLFYMGWRFIRRSNILDVVNEQRKTEPIREVKKWYGIAGAALMVLGIVGAIAIPNIAVSLGYTPPFWANLLYLLVAAGLYMLLIFVVVRGFGGKKSYYKHIITRSMMKFQGRQTVLNMCVIAVLVMAALFAMFYTPLVAAPALISYAERPIDYAFHHRVDEQGIPSQTEIEKMATEEGVAMHGYVEIELVNLATDGYLREWLDNGRFGNEYHEFFAEESFLSESAFRTISGMNVDVPAGGYSFITTSEYSQSPYDYFEDMTLFTNPDTMQTLRVNFDGFMHFDMLHGTIVLDDADYAAITEGLGDGWREKWVQFNVDNVADTYTFATRLKNAIIDGSSDASAVYENYDYVERINAHALGQEYHGDTEPDLQVDFAARESSHFYQHWRYIPLFRVLDQNDFVRNVSVFLMLFVFMAIICMAAVIVIAYTRCLTIAITNWQVYDDLRHLGAKRDYLRRSVKEQLSKVFFVPTAVGAIGIYGFFALILFSNSGGIERGEFWALVVNAGLTLLMCLVLWLVYRITLRKVGRMVGV
ncbi:ABC transporter permease [Ruminococcaceae bacterium OttesenSCG-928-L11]|nr:ABC transporter permease [Ruminococcaceae bacterium OttesenSCG-928-L11]